MTDTLKQIVKTDAPGSVDIPNTWSGFAAWAAVRFGVSFVFAVIIGFAAKQLYEDNRATNEQRYNDAKVHQIELMAYLSNRNDNDAKRAVSDSNLAQALSSLSLAIDRIAQDAKDAHRTSSAVKP